MLDPVGRRWSRWSRPVRRGGARASGAGVTAYRGGLARRGQCGYVTPAFGEVGDSSNCLPPCPGRARALPETAGGRECLEFPRRGAGRRPRDLCGVSASPGPQTRGSRGVVMGKTGPRLEVFPASRPSLLMPSRMLSVFAFSPSLALHRPRGGWGGSAEIVPSCQEEQEGDDQSLSDPRRPLRERWV